MTLRSATATLGSCDGSDGVRCGAAAARLHRCTMMPGGNVTDVRQAPCTAGAFAKSFDWRITSIKRCIYLIYKLNSPEYCNKVRADYWTSICRLSENIVWPLCNHLLRAQNTWYVRVEAQTDNLVQDYWQRKFNFLVELTVALVPNGHTRVVNPNLSCLQV